MRNLKTVCSLKEDGKNYIIYHDLDKGKMYKEHDGNYDELSLNELFFYTGIEKINDRLVTDRELKVAQAKVKKVSQGIVLAAVGLSILTIASSAVYNNYQEKEPVRIYKNSEKSDEDILELFKYAMGKNSTLRDEMAEEILRYLRVFVRECNSLGIDNDDIYFKIVKNLSSIDFSDKGSVYYSDLCNIFDFTNGDFIALELYVYLDEARASTHHELIAGLLFFNDEAKIRVLTGKKLNLELKGDKYKVNLNDLTKNTDKFYDLLREYLHETLEIDDESEVSIYSNIFNPILEEYGETSKISIFYEYHDDELQNVSYREYYKKLASLIYDEAAELDYSNKKDRELIYLYAEALRINFGEQWTEDPIRFILDSIIANYNPLIEPAVSPYNLLRYLNGKNLDISDLNYFWDLALMGKEAIPLIQELNKCFKAEVYAGNMSQDNYDEFINEVVEYIEYLYPDQLEKFKDANLYDKSIDGYQLKIIPSYEL